jgi:hypothetical protein
MRNSKRECRRDIGDTGTYYNTPDDMNLIMRSIEAKKTRKRRKRRKSERKAD